MKRIIHRSTLAACIAAAVWMASLAPTAHSLAHAQQTVVYYNGYGQGYYGGYVPNYGSSYVLVPNNGYSGYGNGPYGNGYGNNPYYYNQHYGQAFRHQPYGLPIQSLNRW